jgi:hypothetical protein
MTTRAKWMVLLLLLATWAGIGVWLVMDANEPQRVPLKFVSGQSGAQRVARGQDNAGLRVDLALLMANRQSGDNSFVAPKNIFRPLKTEREPAAPLPSPKKREAPLQAPAPPAPEPSASESPTIPPPDPLGTAIPVVPAPPPVPVGPSGPTPEELARQAGRQELSQYRYLGYLVRGGRDEAFLSKGKDLHIVKAGETIDQHVLVKAIAPSGVTLQETASQVEHTVALLP